MHTHTHCHSLIQSLYLLHLQFEEWGTMKAGLWIRLTYITDRVSHRGRGAPGISPQPQKSLLGCHNFLNSIGIDEEMVIWYQLEFGNNLPTFRLSSSFQLSSSQCKWLPLYLTLPAKNNRPRFFLNSTRHAILHLAIKHTHGIADVQIWVLESLTAKIKTTEKFRNLDFGKFVQFICGWVYGLWTSKIDVDCLIPFLSWLQMLRLATHKRLPLIV